MTNRAAVRRATTFSLFPGFAELGGEALEIGPPLQRPGGVVAGEGDLDEDEDESKSRPRRWLPFSRH